MPVSLQCDELEAGMRLFEPVVWRERVMLPGGKELTDNDVALLRRRFPELYVRVRDPVLDEVVDFEDDSRDRDVAAAVKEKITGAVSHVETRYTKQASLRKIDFQALREAVDEIMSYLAANPVSAALVTRTFDSGGYLAEHTGNVFYLSMLLGNAARTYVASERQRQSKARELEYSVTRDLSPLGLGVLFMDLGMVPLSKLYQADGSLTKEELQEILAHPVASADMLPDNFSSAAKVVVRSHHENVGGTGYPGGLPAEKIHVLARIVRIADAYESATAKDVFPQARSPVRVLWEMFIGPYRRFYDPELMKAFVGLIQPFPIGAKLRLEDGRQAVVAKYNHRDPFKPVATIAYDADGNALPGSALEAPAPLEPEPGLRIKSYQGEDLSYLYDTGSARDALSLPDKPQTLFDTAYP